MHGLAAGLALLSSGLLQVGAAGFSLPPQMEMPISWRLSKVLAAQVGMTNQWLERQGLVSIRMLWINIHFPKNPRPSLAPLH